MHSEESQECDIEQKTLSSSPGVVLQNSKASKGVQRGRFITNFLVFDTRYELIRVGQWNIWKAQSSSDI